MTDERADASLIAALHRLPRGGGVVFRHHATPAAARRRRFDAVRKIARGRGLLLVLAGSQRQARAWGADGAHGREALQGLGAGLVTASVHDARELRRAATAHLLFVSPVFATRSHPGARPLGAPGFARLARATVQPVVALGGMNAARGERLLRLGGWGWAAIDAWSKEPRSS